MRRDRLLRPLGALATAALAVGGLAACGGGSSSAGSSGSAVNQAGLQAAQAAAKADSVAPTSIGPTMPIGKPIPTGKKIVLVYGGKAAEGGALVFDGFQAAAKELGWSVTSLHPDEPTPQDLQQAVGQAVQLHPDAVITTSVDMTAFQSQAEALQKAKIPLLSNFGPNPTGGPLTLQLMGAEGQGQLAAAIGNKVISDLGGKGEIGVVGLQGYEIVQKYSQYFLNTVQQRCPGCTIKSTQLTLASLGTTAGSDITNFVRANPKIKALFLGYDGLGSSLFSAAKSAGVKLPPVYSMSTLPTSIPVIASGTLTASAPVDLYELGWRTADALARIFTGQTASALTEDVKYERPMIWSSEYKNVPSVAGGNTFPSVVTSYQQQYEKLWGK